MRSNRLWRAVALGLAALVLPTLPAPGASAATAADFVHADRPHDPVFSPKGATGYRPTLIVYVQLADRAQPADRSAAWLSDRFFGNLFMGGEDTDVSHYFRQNSFGRFGLQPVAETHGFADDGVVEVHAGDPDLYFTSDETARSKRFLSLADPYVDFARYDANRDGYLTDDELVIVEVWVASPRWRVLFSGPQFDPDDGGGTRVVDHSVVLGGGDEATVRFRRWEKRFMFVSTATNLMTTAHEVSHQALHAEDNDYWRWGGFDLHGYTIGRAGLHRHYTAWHKMHFGWVRPTVVERDGYYDVGRADASGDTFILHDPSRGAQDYIVVENRGPSTVWSYDRDVADQGLVVWRANDRDALGRDAEHEPLRLLPAAEEVFELGPITVRHLVHATGLAFDASDPLSGGIRAIEPTWADKTQSNVAVRAVGPAGQTMRAYFDVPGPGILVDTWKQPLPIVRPGGTASVTFVARNTGDAEDTFHFTAEQFPPGWTTRGVTAVLPPQKDAVLTVEVTPPADAALADYEFAVRGRGPGDVVSTALSKVRVATVATRVQLKSAYSVIGDGGEALVEVTDEAGNPAAGVAVGFALNKLDPGAVDGQGYDAHTREHQASTGPDGLASMPVPADMDPGQYLLSVRTGPWGGRDEAVESFRYDVLRRAARIEYTGDDRGQFSDPASLSARLVDDKTGAPLADRELTLTAGEQALTATTGVTGEASSAVVLDEPEAAVTATAAFAGDETHLPAVDVQTVTVDPETIALEAVDAAPVACQEAVSADVAVRVVQEDDGFPAPLDGVSVGFTLAGVLSGQQRRATAAVLDGVARARVDSLPCDVWQVDASVASAGFAGGIGSPAELLLADPDGRVEGSASGPSPTGRIRAEVAAFHRDGAPRGSGRIVLSNGTFTVTSVDAVVVHGTSAIVLADGVMEAGGLAGLRAAEPATARLRVDGAGRWFQVVARSAGGTTDTGRVAIDRGRFVTAS